MTLNKGRIVDIKDTYAIVLNDCGKFERIAKKENMQISTSILYTSNDLVVAPRKRIFFWKPQMAFALLLLLMLVATQMRVPTGYALVTLDINPSVEISIDSDNRVISMNPLNNEAETLLENYNLLKKSKVSHVISELIQLSAHMGYINASNQEVIIATTLIQEDIDLKGSNAIAMEIINEIEEDPYTFNVTVVTTASDYKELEASRAQGISLGKYAVSKEDFVPPGQAKKNQEEPVDQVPVETPNYNITEKKPVPPGQEKKEEDQGNKGKKENKKNNNKGNNKGKGN